MRRLFLLAALSLMTMLVFAPAAFGQQDLDCANFDNQEQAQAVYESDTTDPNGLDDDGDGIACETLPSGGAQYRVTPDGLQQSNLPDAIPTEQYVQPVAPAATSTATTATVLPATGGPILLLPAAGILVLGAGLLTAGIARRSR